jgi:hypothetical protein
MISVASKSCHANLSTSKVNCAGLLGLGAVIAESPQPPSEHESALPTQFAVRLRGSSDTVPILGPICAHRLRPEPSALIVRILESPLPGD